MTASLIHRHVCHLFSDQLQKLIQNRFAANLRYLELPCDLITREVLQELANRHPSPHHGHHHRHHHHHCHHPHRRHQHHHLKSMKGRLVSVYWLFNCNASIVIIIAILLASLLSSHRCPNLTHLLLDFSHGAQLADFSELNAFPTKVFNLQILITFPFLQRGS